MRRVGAPDDTETIAIPSPFDFRKQARLFLPKPAMAYVPPAKPSHEGYPRYVETMAQTMIELLHASHGRALVLCTSHRAMRQYADRIAPAVPYRTLLQGDYPRQTLLDLFRDDLHSILFATRSFWQGIDVSGEALSLLIIDRLPFPVPDDPAFKARADALDRERPGQWFHQLSLPMMVLDLRQGVGRLIRRATDNGVIAILDGKLSTKNYGGYVLRSLPPAPQIHSVHAVARFFAEGGRDDDATT